MIVFMGWVQGLVLSITKIIVFRESYNSRKALFKCHKG